MVRALSCSLYWMHWILLLLYLLLCFHLPMSVSSVQHAVLSLLRLLMCLCPFCVCDSVSWGRLGAVILNHKHHLSSICPVNLIWCVCQLHPVFISAVIYFIRPQLFNIKLYLPAPITLTNILIIVSSVGCISECWSETSRVWVMTQQFTPGIKCV